MAQMTVLTRQDIEGCLKHEMSIPQIATKPQAIPAELKTRRIDTNKGLHKSNAIYRWYRECRRTCDRLVSPPFVCNGCENERICPLPKKFYVARVVQADRISKLHESRRGVRATN